MNKLSIVKAFSITTLVVLIGVTADASGQTISAEAQNHMDRGFVAAEAASTNADFKEAILEFQQAATLAPDWPDPYFNLGRLQEKLGQIPYALANYQRYLTLAPNAPDADEVRKLVARLEEAKRHFDRGMAAIEMAKYDPAIDEFEQAASLAPDWPAVYYNLGQLQEGAGRYKDAITNLKQYLRLAPDASDAEMVKTMINKLDYKTETVLTVADVIDVLVSLSNKEQWQATGECISQPFAFIRRKDSDSVEFPKLYVLNSGPDMRLFIPQKIEGTQLQMETNTMCGAPNQAAYWHFMCRNQIEVVSRACFINISVK